MAVESADDLAVFFDPEEFGEAIIYDGVDGFSAIWNRPTEEVPFGRGPVSVGSNTFQLPYSISPPPTPGIVIVVQRTGETFRLLGEPRLSDDGGVWSCGAVPVA